MHTVIKSEEKFKGRVFTAKVEEVILPNGEQTIREVAEHRGSASVVAVTDDNKVVLVRQYRHAAKDFVLEIPAGVLEQGEDPAVCAKRELEEETGVIANEVVPMTKLYLAVGYATEVHHIYLARGLSKGVQNLDEGEDLEIVYMDIDEMTKWFISGDVIDSKTIAGVLAYKEFLLKEKD